MLNHDGIGSADGSGWFPTTGLKVWLYLPLSPFWVALIISSNLLEEG